MDGFVAIRRFRQKHVRLADRDGAAQFGRQCFVYDGTILPGCLVVSARRADRTPQRGIPTTERLLAIVVSVFEAVGAHTNKKIGEAELLSIEPELAAMN